MLLRMVGKSLLRNWGVSLWTLATLTACAALATLFAATALEVEGKMTSALRSMGANAVAFPTEAAKDKAVSSSPWQALEQAARQADADVLRLQVRVGLASGKPLAVVAAEPQALRRMTPYWSVRGRRPTDGDELLAGRRVAESLGMKAGQSLTLHWPGQDGSEAIYKLVGIADCGDEDDDRLFVRALTATASDPHLAMPVVPAHHPPVPGISPGQTANCVSCHSGGPPTTVKATGSAPQPPESPPPTPSDLGSDGFGYALLRVPQGQEGIDAIQHAMQQQGVSLTVNPLRQVLHGEKTILAKVNLLSGVTLVAVVVLAAMGVSAAVLARVVQRRKELALLQALGARRRSVTALLLAESAAVGLAASFLGFGFGALLVQVVVRQAFGVGAWPRPLALGAAVAVTMGVSLLAGHLASRRALRMHPAIALRGE